MTDNPIEEDLVQQLRDELDGLVITDSEQFREDRDRIFRTIAAATERTTITGTILEFASSNDPTYAAAVLRHVARMLGEWFVFEADVVRLTWRVWAEPETGGEWYLPDAPAKRPGSLAIAERMLAGWGYDIVPAGSRRFADGGSTSSTDARSFRGGDIHLQVLAQPGEPVERQLYRAEAELRFFMRTGLGR